MWQKPSRAVVGSRTHGADPMLGEVDDRARYQLIESTPGCRGLCISPH